MYTHLKTAKIKLWIILAVAFAFLFYNIPQTFAQTTDATKAYLLDEDIILYNENSQPVATLKKNNIFFMTETEQGKHYLIQYGDRLLHTSDSIQVTNVDDSSIENNINTGISYSDPVTFEKATSVFSVNNPDLEVAIIEPGQILSIYQEQKDAYQFFLGNRLVQIPKDAAIVKEDYDLSEEQIDSEEKNELDENEAEDPIHQENKVEELQEEDENGVVTEESPDPDNNVVNGQVVEEDTKVSNSEPISITANSTLNKSAILSEPKFNHFFKAIGINTPVYINRGGETVQVGNLVSGQEYVIISQIDGFLRINYGNGFGYVRTSANIVPSDGSSIKNKNNGLVNKGRTIQAKQNVVIYDNTSGSLVPFGELALEETYPTVMQTSKDWFQVLFGGRIGYVYKPHLIVQVDNSDAFFQPYYSNTPIYINQAGKTVKVGDLKQNQEFSIVGQDSSFVKIQYGNGIAYVRKSHISASDGKSIKNHSTAPYVNNGRVVRAKIDMPVYDNTSGSLVEFGRIDKDQEYITVMETSTYWIQVNLGGRIGYIYKPHAKIEFSSADKYFRPLGENVDIILNEQGKNIVVGKLSNEQEFPILSQIDGFVRIQYGNGFAYVRTDSIYPSNGGTIKNINPGRKNSKDQFRTARIVPIYDNTSGSLVEFAALEPGQSYHIIRQTSADWYEVSVGNRIGYVYRPWVEMGPIIKETLYGLTFQEMLNIQLNQSPQTDAKYRAFVSANYIDSNNIVIANSLNVRGGASATYWALGKLSYGQKVEIIGTVNSSDRNDPVWYEIRYTPTWKNASPDDVAYYLNPNNFDQDNFQFLVLSETAKLDATEVNNKILADKGILKGKASVFIEAAMMYGVNEIYLMSHAFLETGNGKSELANGVIYNGQVVYNMYGVGAYDNCAKDCGAKFAYDNQWFTPEAAIFGAAKFVSTNYLSNTVFKQDTLYKMRWNPVQPWHQYATDIGWASKQVKNIQRIYDLLDTYTLTFDIPVYK
ncbi:glucosaminidase domain-containing protein [Bacillus sp. FJAT-50079]|uniref:N-acetylglucosaminidase n=1 Tax=Bacillus sp. FJAT-50079 TaxID=2833577 RepID=UPI001BC9202D|nr:glucosaminidase domain-containing protein [Bacillus sp. FJAT-50079]MBS4206747.1 glucosaminidase domain-containing protein [Bacillus sp. FJAT-50079]